jgi:hypothetical protein
MEAASPPLSFPVSAVQATGPPLRPQGSLPRSLRDGHCGPPLTPEPSTAPHHAVAGGQEQSPCPPNRTALTIQIPQNKVSTVTGDCQIGAVVVAELRTAGYMESTIGQYAKTIKALSEFASERDYSVALGAEFASMTTSVRTGRLVRSAGSITGVWLACSIRMYAPGGSTCRFVGVVAGAYSPW